MDKFMGIAKKNNTQIHGHNGLTPSDGLYSTMQG